MILGKDEDSLIIIRDGVDQAVHYTVHAMVQLYADRSVEKLYMDPGEVEQLGKGNLGSFFKQFEAAVAPTVKLAASTSCRVLQ